MFSIIGNGFVGNAIYQTMKDHYEVFVYDKDKSKSRNTIEEINKTKLVFMCVPTPMGIDGDFDVSILNSAITMLSPNKILIIKSTIPPSNAAGLIECFPEHSFVFNPEFLTERTAVEDFRNPTRIVLGGDKPDVEKVKELYQPIFKGVRIIETDYKTACFIKYYCNCFYAVKVSIINEFKQIADQEGVDWDVANIGLLSSGWVNRMHTLVPGPDGQLGFGGKCFPKDIRAFIGFSKSLGIDPKIMQAAWDKNLEVRENPDWCNIDGVLTKEEE